MVTHPVQVPHAAFFLVIFLQGVIAMKLPGTHTHTKEKDKTILEISLEC